MTAEKEVLRERLAELEKRLAELEAERHEEMNLDRLMRRVLPGEVQDHLRNARREQLLALRAMIDRWIERVDETSGERVRRRESISVD